MQVELQDQPPVTEEIDGQVQDVGKATVEEQLATQYNYLIKCLSMQVELQDQPPVTEEIDGQVQDVGKATVEEQWHLRDNVMAAFNTIFEGYKTINTRFMNMCKLIDGTPLHSMGNILNDIQESVARSVGYGGGGCGR